MEHLSDEEKIDLEARIQDATQRLVAAGRGMPQVDTVLAAVTMARDYPARLVHLGNKPGFLDAVRLMIASYLEDLADAA